MNSRTTAAYIIGGSIVGLVSLGIGAGLSPDWVEPIVSPGQSISASLEQLSLPVVEQETGSYEIDIATGMVVVDRTGLRYFFSQDREATFLMRESMIGGDSSSIVGRGNNLRQGVEGVPTYSSVWYEGVWEGIDIEVVESNNSIEKIIYVPVGVDPYLIQFELIADTVDLSLDGAITATRSQEMLTKSAPVVWQDIEGKRVNIEGSYELQGSYYGFVLGQYDPASELIILEKYLFDNTENIAQ